MSALGCGLGRGLGRGKAVQRSISMEQLIDTLHLQFIAKRLRNVLRQN